MGREIKAATLEVISHGDKDESPELDLLRMIKAMVKAGVVDAHLAGLNSFQERDQPRPKLCEERRELAHCGAWLIGIQ